MRLHRDAIVQRPVWSNDGDIRSMEVLSFAAGIGVVYLMQRSMMKLAYLAQIPPVLKTRLPSSPIENLK